MLAKVGPNDYLIDLGSGDGRLVITAVAKYKARGGMGVEIDRSLVKHATEQAEKAGVAGRVTFVAGDLFVADIGQATVVTLYLLPSMMADVEAKLRKELKPGTRIVSHEYPLPSWKPVDVVTFDTPEKVPISGCARRHTARKCAHIELRVACLEATVGGVVESSFVVTPSDTGFWTAELP